MGILMLAAEQSMRGRPPCAEAELGPERFLYVRGKLVAYSDERWAVPDSPEVLEQPRARRAS